MAVYWAQTESHLGLIRVATSDVGLCAVGFPNESEDLFLARCQRRFGSTITLDEERNAEVLEQIEAYLGGRRTDFDLVLDLSGTDFQVSVWKELTSIPYGATRSYGEIAAAIGRPKACRAVGTANAQNMIPIVVPCHRVIGAAGNLVGFGGGLDIKRKLLALEGSSAV